MRFWQIYLNNMCKKEINRFKIEGIDDGHAAVNDHADINVYGI